MKVHKLGPNHPKIMAAKPIEAVWPDFEATINQWTKNGGKKGLVVAWSGETCDIQWLFNVTEVSHKGSLKLPKGLSYFMDPCQVISHYKSCPLNEKNRGEVGHALEIVYCFVTGKTTLVNAHDAIVDATAQLEVILDERFKLFMDKPKSIKLMKDVFTKKAQKKQEQVDELKRKVPPGWTEDYTTFRIPKTEQTYQGSGGGPDYGPTRQCREAANGGLTDLFYFFMPVSLLQKIATSSEHYGRNEWVRPVPTKDKDGKDTTKHMFVCCESWHPDARKRCGKNDSAGLDLWRTITIGYILAWLGILMINGAFKI